MLKSKQKFDQGWLLQQIIRHGRPQFWEGLFKYPAQCSQTAQLFLWPRSHRLPCLLLDAVQLGLEKLNIIIPVPHQPFNIRGWKLETRKLEQEEA